MKNSFYYCLVILIMSVLSGAFDQPTPKETDKAQNQSAEHASTDSTELTDPLGRSNPHGTVFGFLQDAQNGKYKEAAQFLQLSKNERQTEGEGLAHQLHALMDNAFVGRVGAISNRREGSVQVGVSPDHEQIGVFRINGSERNVDLVRVTDPTAGEIWLFSSDILADVPDLFSQLESNEVESRLPGFLRTTRVLSTPLWRLIAFLLLIPLAYGLAWAVVHLLRGGQRIWLRWKHHPLVEDVHTSLAAPATLILTVVFHQIGVYFLGAPLLIRVYYQRFIGIILVASFGWLIFRLVNRWGERARLNALTGSGYRNGSIVLLGQRILNAMVVIVAVLVMLSILGVDISTVVAGLGIGSIAIAFAAQKTLENLLGGIAILGDQVIRVGEVCRIGDKIGTVEDISLRSTRIRTLDRSELSVPNGQLANMNVENLSRSNNSSFREKIVLHHETSPDQLRLLLKEIPILIREHPKVDQDFVRVHFVGFGESGLDVDIHCRILTGELVEFLAIRERLLLEIMDLMAGMGIEYALPSRALYLKQRQNEGHQQTTAQDKTSELRHAS